MLTNLEIAIITYLLNREGKKFDVHNTVFKSRCFTGGGRYLHFKFNDSVNFVSDSVKIDMIEEMGFYLFCTIFCQDQDNQYLQVTVNNVTEMNDYFSEDAFCLIKGKDVDVESIDLTS